ncbi:WD40 repeat domain-containing protein [Rhodovarius crocodyli]|uniref:WD40 repeat domain-containing protein n=1 Tax=Rhodovarius crocodyli TaxID=1979269 RepID=UPI000FD9BAA1|nr:hypothetical protein [Rhodovarius crocodyli]
MLLASACSNLVEPRIPEPWVAPAEVAAEYGGTPSLLAISPDGSRLAIAIRTLISGGEDHWSSSVAVVDADSGRILVRTSAEPGQIDSMAISADNGRLLLSRRCNPYPNPSCASAAEYDVNSGQVITRHQLPILGSSEVGFSANGRPLVLFHGYMLSYATLHALNGNHPTRVGTWSGYQVNRVSFGGFDSNGSVRIITDTGQMILDPEARPSTSRPPSPGVPRLGNAVPAIGTPRPYLQFATRSAEGWENGPPYINLADEVAHVRYTPIGMPARVIELPDNVQVMSHAMTIDGHRAAYIGAPAGASPALYMMELAGGSAPVIRRLQSLSELRLGRTALNARFEATDLLARLHAATLRGVAVNPARMLALLGLRSAGLPAPRGHPGREWLTGELSPTGYLAYAGSGRGHGLERFAVALLLGPNIGPCITADAVSDLFGVPDPDRFMPRWRTFRQARNEMEYRYGNGAWIRFTFGHQSCVLGVELGRAFSAELASQARLQP